ncbi:MAG: 16S rRNA (cytosine(1402)-N(4))-methyltransferase RsmH [Alphaproteobacteria bacterium]|nr:16S rRNA (cytosine(1402)-N(4))-methyltransferase RsmH [Alphaproteobacteria bacterium]
MTTHPLHVPVLLREVIAALSPADGEIIVDGTFGAGGYTGALLDAAACRVVAIDRDPDALARAKPHERLTLVAGRFGEMEALLAERGIALVDGVTLDIGVSSMQIDDAERGFSFMRDGPLDMRMEREGASAADVVNNAEEADLADIIFHLGEERHARRVARAIRVRRAERPFQRTLDLADVVRGVVPRSGDGIDPATRTFQALRIHVNDELGELSRGLSAAERMLKPGGRLAVVTFHSLEDRAVKTFLQRRAGSAPRPSRHVPAAPEARASSFELLKRKPVTAAHDELAANPRSRSAKLRAARRTHAPAWPADLGGVR